MIYATVRAFLQNNYYVAEYHYLTPFYSPCISKGCVPEASHFWPQILPDVWWLPYAAVSLPFLLLFRLTCYYYRGAYYRSVWQSPTACAVAEPHAKYTGETRFPLIIQNTHRYFFYIAGDHLGDQHLRRDRGVPVPVRLRIRFGQRHSRGQRDPAVDLHGVVPLLPPRRRRPAQALLQTPRPVLDVDAGQQAQHPAQACTRGSRSAR